jgi:thiamine-phosphate pyrophosphorylase
VIRAVPRLHAVTNDAVLARASLATMARALARPGVALHARGRAISAAALTSRSRLLSDVAHARNALALVNDRADIARIVGADGVHLPEAGLPLSAARRILGPAALVGRSVHAPDDARRAADDGADFVFLGPIFATATHPDARPLGLAALRGLTAVRVIAIGGITPERVARCREAGAYGVAAVSALWQAPDAGAVVEAMLVSLSDSSAA